jgi:hypothetical protein
MYTYNGSLAKIDLNNNNSVTIYELPYNLGNHEEPYTPQNDFRRPVPTYLALDGDGNIWIACEDYNWHPMLGITEIPVIKFIVENETFDVIWVPNRGSRIFDVAFDGHYMWLELNQLIAIDYKTNEVVYNTGAYFGWRLVADGDIIWSSSGKFNTTDHTLQGINGTMAPCGGIAYDKNYVYYAEGIEVHGSIVQVNKADMTIVQRITPAPAWTTDVCVDKDGNIWWVANGYMGVVNPQVGISGINFTYPARALVTMTEVPSHGIWFSYTDGSTGGGAKYLSYIESEAVAGVGHIGLSKIRIDVNKDKVVNMKDIGLVARQFGTNENSTNWIPLTDICEPLDGKVDMKDVSMVARHFGEKVE